MEDKHDALHAVADHILWNREEGVLRVYYRL